MVYVTDIGRGVVLKFTPDGKHLATIQGNKRDQLHQFGRPTFICINLNDIMYVTDRSKSQRESFLEVMLTIWEEIFLSLWVSRRQVS